MSQGYPALYFVFTFLVGGIAVGILVRRRSDVALVLFVFILSLVTRCIVSFLNRFIDILPEKDAGEYALMLYYNQSDLSFSNIAEKFTDPLTFLLTSKFMVQALLNSPGMLLTGRDASVLALTNGFITAFAGVIVYVYLERLFNRSTARVGLIIASIYPAAINFSMFGLRDPILYFFLILSILSFSWCYLRSDAKVLNIFLFVMSAVFVGAERTNLFAIVILMPISAVMLRLFIIARSSIRPRWRIVVMTASALVVLVAVTGASFLAYQFVLVRFNVDSLVTPFQLVELYTQTKYDRTVEEQGGFESGFLPPAMYASLPAPVKLIVQFFGMIIIPFPWLLTTVPRLLAFVDTIFFLFIGICAFKAVFRRLAMPDRRGAADRRLFGILLVCFAIDLIGMSILTWNAGNAFRMRMSITPFLYVPASVYVAYAMARIADTRTRRMAIPVGEA